MTEQSIVYDPQREEQLRFDGEKLVLDDSAILDDDSTADYGARLGDLAVEIWGLPGENNLEVYPLDGRDEPIDVEIIYSKGFDSEELILGVVAAALSARTQMDASQ